MSEETKRRLNKLWQLLELARGRYDNAIGTKREVRARRRYLIAANDYRRALEASIPRLK